MGDSLKVRTISSLFWKMLERGGSAIVSLVVQIVMARLLLPNDFGLLAIMLVFINLSDVLAKSGLVSALVQTPDAAEDDFSTVFWITFVLSWVLYAAVFVAASYIGAFYGSPEMAAPLRVLALVLPINAFNGVQWSKVARDLVFRKTFISTVTSTLISGAIGIALALNGAGLWALVAQQVSAKIVSCAVLKMQVPWFPKLAFNSKRAIELFSFSWKLLVSGLLTTASQSLQSLIIGKRFDTSELGLVSQGEKYPSAIARMIDGTIQGVMMPVVSRVQDDKDYVCKIVRRATKTSSFIIFPIMGLLALVAEPLVLLLLGEKWAPCIPFFQMYCFIYAQLAIQSSSLQALIGMGRSDIFLKIDVVNKTIAVIVLLVATFVFQSVYAVVVGAMICAIQASLLDILPNSRILGYTYRDVVKDTAPSFFLTFLTAGIASSLALVGLSPLLLLVAQILVMGGLYLLIAKIAKFDELVYLLGALRETLGSRFGGAD